MLKLLPVYRELRWRMVLFLKGESILIGSQENIETTSYKNLFYAIHGIGFIRWNVKK